MGWERGGRYTRSVRVNGKVVRRYVGSGSAAKAAAELDAQRRAEREAKAAKVREAKQQLAAQMADLDAALEPALLLARAALLAAGFRQHKRGEWRRKRGG
jgi:hypothetical protein